MPNSSIYDIDRTLSGATTLGQSEPGHIGNEGVLWIPQSSSITETSPSDCLVSYPEPWLRVRGLTTLQKSSRVFYSWLGKICDVVSNYVTILKRILLRVIEY